MSYVVQPHYDPAMPSWQKDAKPYGLIACHDTEGGTGVAGANGTIAFLLSTADQRQASYHEIWAWEAGALTVIPIVPATRAAGSIGPQTPAQGGHYVPDAWVTASLGANSWDPNQCVYAVSIAGKVADVASYAASAAFIAAANSRLIDLSLQLHVTRLAEHFRFQNDRSDWGPVLTNALGGLTIKPSALYGLPGWPDYARSTLAGAESYAYRIFVNAKRAPATAKSGGWGVPTWPSYARFSLEQASAYALRIFINNPNYKP